MRLGTITPVVLGLLGSAITTIVLGLGGAIAIVLRAWLPIAALRTVWGLRLSVAIAALVVALIAILRLHRLLPIAALVIAALRRCFPAVQKLDIVYHDL